MAQPPPSTGDGVRDKDMPTSSPGVGGTAGRGWANRREGQTALASKVEEALVGVFMLSDALAREDRRRRWPPCCEATLTEAQRAKLTAREVSTRACGGEEEMKEGGMRPQQ